MPLLTLAQATATPGVPYEVIDANSKNYFHHGDEILSVKIHGKTVSLQKFNVKTLKQLKRKDIENMPPGFDFEIVEEMGGRYYFFYKLWNKAEKRLEFYNREISFANCDFAGKEKMMLAVNGKTSNVNFQFSYGKTKMLLTYRNDEDRVRNDSRNYEEYGVHVFDENLSPVSGNMVSMPYSEKKMDLIDYTVDGDGNSYILTTVFDDNSSHEKKDREGNANYHIELFKLKVNSTKFEITTIGLTDNFINKLWIYESPSGEMLCTGFYNNSPQLASADGIMMFKLTKDLKITDMKTFEIPVDVLNMYVSEKTQKRNKKKDDMGDAEFDNLVFRRLVVGEDGSFLLIGEQYYYVTRTYTDGQGHTRTTTTYYYNDMLVAKIDAKGNMAWIKKLPKRQTASSRGGVGFAYMFMNDSHYLVFQDNKKNKYLNENHKPEIFSDGADGVLTAFRVNDGNGEMSRISILECDDFQGMELHQLNMGRILKVSEDEFVFEAYKKKKEDILVKVKMK